jgi:hypothetical protein
MLPATTCSAASDNAAIAGRMILMRNVMGIVMSIACLVKSCLLTATRRVPRLAPVGKRRE